MRRKEQLIIFLPTLGLLVLIIVLYSPQIGGLFDPSFTIPGLSELKIAEKTDMMLTFTIAVFAAIEGYSMFKRAFLEDKRFKVDDASSEIEKAYGPLYTLLNKVAPSESGKNSFWLEFEERKKIDEIMATYPFMFPQKINEFWQQKIRKPQSLVQTSNLDLAGLGIDLGAYLEFRKMVNAEYDLRVEKYRELIEK